MATVIATGGRLPKDRRRTNALIDALPAKRAEQRQTDALRRALSGGGTRQEQLQQLFSSNAGVRGFLGNAPAVEKAFGLSADPGAVPNAELLGSVSTKGVGKVVESLQTGRTGKDAFSASPAGEAAFQKQQNVEQVFDEFGQPSFKDDPDIKAQLDADKARGGKALLEEAEAELKSIEDFNKKAGAAFKEAVKKPTISTESIINQKVAALNKSRQGTAKEEAILSKIAKRIDAINDLPDPEERALSLKNLDKSPLGRQLKQTQKSLDEKIKNNQALDKSIAEARAKAIEEEEEGVSGIELKDLPVKLKGLMLMDGINSLEEWANQPLESRNKLTQKYNRELSSDKINSSISGVKNLVGKDGNTVGFGVVITTFNKETGESKSRFVRTDNSGNYMVASVVGQKTSDIAPTAAIRAKLLDRNLTFRAGRTAATNFFNRHIKDRSDDELNQLLGAAGGITKALSRIKGAFVGMNKTFAFGSIESFESALRTRPGMTKAMQSVAEDSAGLFAEYAFTLFQVAVAGSGASAGRLSDRDMAILKQMLEVREGGQLRRTVKTSVQLMDDGFKDTAKLLAQKDLFEALNDDSFSMIELDEATGTITDVRKPNENKDQETDAESVDRLF